MEGAGGRGFLGWVGFVGVRGVVGGEACEKKTYTAAFPGRGYFLV